MAVETVCSDVRAVKLTVSNSGIDKTLEASVLRRLLDTYCETGQAVTQTIRLNVPASEGTPDALV